MDRFSKLTPRYYILVKLIPLLVSRAGTPDSEMDGCSCTEPQYLRASVPRSRMAVPVAGMAVPVRSLSPFVPLCLGPGWLFLYGASVPPCLCASVQDGLFQGCWV
ncbi:hypothetical protein EOD39_20895 [Acipenser ruthenus]|uniref:Uncharacterized protein n=1 Tax=Acipenser ruthenus TaxID=7906 RepID=A0A444UU62_ACIRT|nr:hypothetical protein EOD39_20895 [Acipenser ruthenus]